MWQLNFLKDPGEQDRNRIANGDQIISRPLQPVLSVVSVYCLLLVRYVQSPQSLTVHISITGQLKMENLELTMFIRCCVDMLILNTGQLDTRLDMTK